MTSRRSLITWLVVCAALGLAGSSAVVAAPKPSPQELWELYPLDPTGSGARQRPRTPIVRQTTTQGEARPRGGVAGVTRTQQQPRVVVRDEGRGTPVAVGLMIGVASAAIILLALAALPPAAALGRVAGLVVDRRIDLLLAGVSALLLVTIVYLVGGY
jgi:hypothetical protein